MTRYGDVRAYYVEKWGQPAREARFNKGELVVGILKWEAGVATQGVYLYATIGASDYALPGLDVDHRQEFFAGFSSEFDDIASPLAWLGIQSHITEKAFSVGHTFRKPEGLIAGTDFMGFLIRGAPADEEAAISLADGRHIEFLRAIPVHGSELDYIASHGSDSLMEKMGASNVPLFDPERESVVPT